MNIHTLVKLTLLVLTVLKSPMIHNFRNFYRCNYLNDRNHIWVFVLFIYQYKYIFFYSNLFEIIILDKSFFIYLFMIKYDGLLTYTINIYIYIYCYQTLFTKMLTTMRIIDLLVLFNLKKKTFDIPLQE